MVLEVSTYARATIKASKGPEFLPTSSYLINAIGVQDLVFNGEDDARTFTGFIKWALNPSSEITD